MKYPAVYIYKHTSDNGAELKTSIRSLVNLTNWNGQVFVVGDSELWFSDKLQHIPSKDYSTNPYLDSENKLYTATISEQIPDDFIFMMDDVYLLEPVTAGYLYMDELADNPTGHNNLQKTNTRNWLIQNGYDYRNYDIHVPMLINKTKYQKIHDIFIQYEHPETLKPRSLYGNIYKVGGEYYADAKTRSYTLPDRPIVSTQYHTLETEWKFPKPSRFEKIKDQNKNTKYSVSVVIPVYNQPELVLRLLKSIPDHKAIKEILVCDDASTDNTWQVLQGIKDKRLRLLQNEHNRGVGHTVNRLLDEAKCDYVLRVDSDDYLLPSMADVIDLLDGKDIYYFNRFENDGTLEIQTEYNKRKLVAPFHVIKRTFIGDTRNDGQRWGEDANFIHKLLDKKPSETFTNIVAYHYNFPREDSLMGIRAKRIHRRYKLELNLFTNATASIAERQTIFATYDSFTATFGEPDKLTVYYDPNPNKTHAQGYLERLVARFDENIVNTTSLADGYVKSVLNAEHEYIFQLEADWQLQNIDKNYDDIIELMKTNQLFYLRFNKMANRHIGWLDKWETHFKPKDGYCETDNISNNPHILNVQYYKTNMLDKIDTTLGGSLGIEQNLEARKIIGAMYGGLDYPTTAVHLDGSNSGYK